MERRSFHILEFCLFAIAFGLAAPAAAQTLSASPSAVVIQYSAGQQTPEPVLVTITASGGTLGTIGATLTPQGATPPGLFPLTVAGSTISVAVDRATLTTLVNAGGGIFQASITVTASGFPSLNVPVTLDIGGSLSISASVTSLTFNLLAGTATQTIELTGTSNSSVSFDLQFATTSGGNWLNVTSNSTFTPATLTVTATPGSLTAGIYLGSITITPQPGGVLTIPVTLQAGTSTLTVSPASLSFSFETGSTSLPQVLHVSSTVANATYTAQPVSTGNWLLVNGVSHQVSGSLPVDLNVTINPAGLGFGTYTGTIAVNASDGSTQSVVVTLVVTTISAIANPTALVFVGRAGGSAPATQVVLVNGPTTGSFNAVPSSQGGQWLAVSRISGPTPTQLTVTVTTAGLAAGTYTGNIAITTAAGLQNVAVSLTISANPVLITSSGALVFNYAAGSPVPPVVTITVDVDSGGPQTFSLAPGQPSWLKLTGLTTTFTTPFFYEVGVDPTGLQSGTYLSDMILTPTAKGGVPIAVPILLVVSGATPVVSNLSTLTFNAAAGGGPQTQTIQVTASTATPFTTSATTTGGGAWLSVSPASGTANTTATPVTVTADATLLAVGTYQGTVSLTSNTGAVTTVAVTINVTTTGTVPISVTPTALTFAYSAGGDLPAAQTLQIGGTQSFTVNVATKAGGPWLAVTPLSGTGPTSLNVTVNPNGLAAAAYTGVITLTPSSGTPLTVSVTLTVTSLSTITASQNSLAFFYRSGDVNPAAQSVTVSASGPAVAFTASSSDAWLSVTPSAATTPATLTISVDPTDLGNGTYTGTITLTGGSGSPVTIQVTLSVSTPLPSIQTVVNAASYLGSSISPGEIVVVFGTFLGPSVGVSANIDSAGFIETTLANVQVTFNGFPGPVLYASGGQINTIVPYEVAGTSSAQVEVSFGKARSNSVNLLVAPSAPGIFSADASGTGPGAILDVHYHLVTSANPVSRGSVIQIYATGEGVTNPASVDGKIAPDALPLPSPKLSVGVLIGGLPADIQYVGAAPGLVAGALQVNAYIPDAAVSGPNSVVLKIGDSFSQPGITVAVK